MSCKMSQKIEAILERAGAGIADSKAHQLAALGTALAGLVGLNPSALEPALAKVSALLGDTDGVPEEILLAAEEIPEIDAGLWLYQSLITGRVDRYQGLRVPKMAPAELARDGYRAVRDFLAAANAFDSWDEFVQEQKMGDCEEIAQAVELCFGFKKCFGVLDVDIAFDIDHTLDADYVPFMEEDDPEGFEEWLEGWEDEGPTKEVWHYWNMAPDGCILDFAKGTVQDMIPGIDLSHPFPDSEARDHRDAV